MKTQNNPNKLCGIRSWVPVCLAGLVIAGLNPSAARADAIVSSASHTGNAGVSTGETLGYGFDVGSQPISIYSLGLWSWNNTASWVEGSQLGIWNSSGSLVASVTLPASPSLVLDSIVYEDITPVVLNANSTYSIGFYNTGQMIMGGTVTYTPGSDITIDYPQMSFPSSGLSFPNQVLSVYGHEPFLGANALYNIIPAPEPSALALLAVGAVALLVRRRRNLAA